MLFARCDVGVLESILFHELEEYSVVNSSEGTLEDRVGCAYILLEIFASSYIMLCVERLSYMFMWERNPSAVSLNMHSDSAVWVPMLVRMDVHNSRMQFIRAMGL